MTKKSIETPEAPTCLLISDNPNEWYYDILRYMREGYRPPDKNQAKKLQRQASWFCIFQGELYKKPFSLPLLRCVTKAEDQKVIEQINEGICGNHVGGKALSLKALRAGYYWPTMLQDAKDYVKRCDKCQRFAPIIHMPANDLQPIMNPISFAQWGMDILGPFPQASGRRKFLIVAIDYFTK